MLHLEMSNLSDRVAHDGRSTCDECMCYRNAHEPFLNHMQACLAPKPHVFELQRMCKRSCKCASLAITHNNQTTNQTIHFKHNNSITWAEAVLGI